MKKVVWSPTARKSLKQTVAFIIELWNEDVAKDFLNLLNYRIEQVQRNPALGPKFHDSRIRKLVIHKTISIFYLEKPQHLKLLLVWDSRQDPEKFRKQLTDH
jgi:plasmid stabilization system protein ParE